MCVCVCPPVITRSYSGRPYKQKVLWLKTTCTYHYKNLESFIFDTFWEKLKENKQYFYYLGAKSGVKILIFFYECCPKIYRFHRNPPKRFFFFFWGKCVRRNNHIKSTRSRCERRRVVCLHWTLKKDIGNFHFVTIKYFRKSAENYLFVIDTMIDQKYLSQIGQKMCNFAWKITFSKI